MDDSTKSGSAHKMSEMVRRGLSNPATNQLARGPWAGRHEVRSAVGGEVDVNFGQPSDVYRSKWASLKGIREMDGVKR